MIVKESWHDYLRRDELNGSTLVHGLKSMRQMKYAICNPRRETQAMQLGTAAHTLLEFTPEEFEAHFDVMPDFANHPDNCTGSGMQSSSSTTSWCKKQMQEFSDNSEKEIIAQKTYDEAQGIIEALYSHTPCREILDASIKEATVLGEVEGVPFKGRIDMLAVKERHFSDFKTTQSVIPRKFAYISEQFEYVFKMRLYQRLLKSLGLEMDHVYLLIVESQGAHDRCRMEVPRAALENADVQINSVLSQYKDSVASGVWPGMFETSDPEMYINPWKMEEETEVFQG